MTGIFVQVLAAIRGLHGTLQVRACNERGASMVEYALLVGLIAVVAVIAVSALGVGIQGLFNNANTCVSTLTQANC